MVVFLVEPVSEVLNSPIVVFVLLLAIALIIPPIFERLKLPGLVGLLAAGVLFGGSALGWLDPDSETMKLLSEIGKIYLMFAAGLEIDLALFQKTRNRSLTFGALTFAIPFISGVAIGLVFGFGWLAAVLIGSLLASHTLLAYPIVQRLGVVSDEAVTVTVGATIFTDIASLVVLAICLGVSRGDFTTGKLVILLASLGAYAIAVLFGLKQLAAAFFRATGKDEGNQFLFVMLSVFLAAVGAQLVGVEGIIGAFLAGLAINSVIGNGAVKEKTEFLGSVLFIPMFFVHMGLLLDLDALRGLIQFVVLPLTIVGALLGSKLLAALTTQRLFGYSWPQTWTMWSLSIPQVAATLAAALVGYQADIINTQVFNSVILLMLVTSIMGPLITARTARQVALLNAADDVEPLSWLPLPAENSQIAKSQRFAIVVPIYNPKTEIWLLELAAIIAQYEHGQVVPLAVALASNQMDSPQLKRAVSHSYRRLDLAKTMGEQWSVPMEPVMRIEYSVPQAICHVSREQEANLILLGMGRPLKFDAPLLSSVHDDVLWSAHCPVVVARLLRAPAEFKNILLPIENPSSLTIRVMRFAQVLAAANQGRVTLLHVCGSLTSQDHREQLRSQLKSLIDQLPAANCKIKVELVVKDSIVGAIAQLESQYDLVIVRSQRRQMAGGLRMATTAQPLFKRLTGSVVLVGEPYPSRPVRKR
ncbi:MAG: transporter, CPA2 family [Phormidesmis priestleyi Ana]|uniref:Transporter, CPA2 family n=1 Tax=Phormidesmis priestleyi Ana TaxID=1666911 RepID=A0A0P7ZLM2_9CYAN|nr:MAG: transporter, CPA2 family [Phormidesmis priestleyi Ana]